MYKEIIKLRHINKKLNLPPGITLDLLSDVNITIPQGQFVTITGQSGSGKSTLLGILSGYEKGDSGYVMIDNKDIGQMNKRQLEEFKSKNMGICYADKAPIILTSTVKENIYQRLLFFFDKDIEQKAEYILTTFKLTSIANHKVLSCTFMNLYRLMLASAFCGPPPIIIIDEILDYFTLEERRELLQTMLSLQKQYSITIVLITMELDIMKQSDRVINIMNQTTYEVDMNRLRAITDKV